MKRRGFLATLPLLGLPKIAIAKLSTHPYRVGWVVDSSPRASMPYLEPLRAGLAERGYVEGRNLIIEARFGDEEPDRVPGLIDQLLAIPVDVIVTQGTTTWAVLKRVTDVPVVYVFSADPVEAGFAKSFARPGGNATGLTLMSIEMNGKRLELLREILPRLRQATIVANPDHRGEHLERQDSEATARHLGIGIRYFPVHNVAELEASLKSIAAEETEAIVLFPDAITIRHRERIINFATTRRIPVISGWAMFAESGALCTYGPRLSESYRHAASFVDRVLKGTKPAEIPVERPTIFELVLNLKAASELGLTLPPAVLARADRVIE
jgi:putative tryptophan/tyrosine transport system substrate-binding protein